jgi:hypothetical protein
MGCWGGRVARPWIAGWRFEATNRLRRRARSVQASGQSPQAMANLLKSRLFEPTESQISMGQPMSERRLAANTVPNATRQLADARHGNGLLHVTGQDLHERQKELFAVLPGIAGASRILFPSLSHETPGFGRAGGPSSPAGGKWYQCFVVSVLMETSDDSA